MGKCQADNVWWDQGEISGVFEKVQGNMFHKGDPRSIGSKFQEYIADMIGHIASSNWHKQGGIDIGKGPECPEDQSLDIVS